MKNKLFGVIGFLAIILVLTTGVTLSISASTTNLYQDQPHVNYDEVLDSDIPTIYYYYQDTCHFCDSIKGQLTAFSTILNNTAGIDFKLVDMKATENQAAWYDWDYHNKTYGGNNPKENPDYIYEPEKMKTVDDIKITGTPTMIYVKDHKVFDYKVGDEVFDILEEVRDEFNIDYEFDRSRYGQS